MIKKIIWSSFVVLASIATISGLSYTQNTATLAKNNDNLEEYFENKVVKKTLKIKDAMRIFNEKYFLLASKYHYVSENLSALIEEQSLANLKQNLQEFYNEYFEEVNKENISKYLWEFVFLYDKTRTTLSDINFYLENKVFSDNIEQEKQEIEQFYLENIENKNLNTDLFSYSKIPIINLINEIKIRLLKINELANQNKIQIFQSAYNEAKTNIYDNINHTNLDNDFNVMFEILSLNFDDKIFENIE
ncbi:hypothetical protein N8G13_01990 [Mycoplasma zalophi]|uniref:hypothetical protein n=1 Tax=Mycoplasma zalophi TaxID=191287 RepID=UPI0021C5941F|nr:hypothetical protein [Mycoplasma zalophi]MCU4117225.1 hypothetical protein [Mycoplasma zalophi]